MENIALFFHLLGAFAFVAGMLVAGVAFETARRREAPAEIALLLELSRVGVVFVAAGTALTLGFGLWLVDLGGWGYGADWIDAAIALLVVVVVIGGVGGWGYGADWIDAAIALLVVVVVIGGVGGQRPKRARKLARRLADDGAPSSPELRALLDDRAARGLNYLAVLILLAILVLMVFKPGARA